MMKQTISSIAARYIKYKTKDTNTVSGNEVLRKEGSFLIIQNGSSGEFKERSSLGGKLTAEGDSTTPRP